MNRIFNIHGIEFEIANRTPRRNEFERGLKYGLFVDGVPVNCFFSTIKSGRKFVTENWFIYA